MQPNKADELLRKRLQAEIAEFEEALSTRKRMLALLESPSQKTSRYIPQTKHWLLRKYLELYHPDGIPISSVPEALKTMGFISKELVPTTNWLRQLKPHHNFFIVTDGLVTLRSNLAEIDRTYGYVADASGEFKPDFLAS